MKNIAYHFEMAYAGIITSGKLRVLDKKKMAGCFELPLPYFAVVRSTNMLIKLSPKVLK